MMSLGLVLTCEITVNGGFNGCGRQHKNVGGYVVALLSILFLLMLFIVAVAGC